MISPSLSQRQRHALKLGFAILTAVLLYFCALSANAQSFSSTAGLLQGERVARVTTLYDGIIKAAADTTSWLRFGTHTADLASERVFAPTRFTLFVKVDTATVAHAADPSITVSAQVALDDTTVIYEQWDESLILIPTTDPLTIAGTGVSLPIPVYGGGYLRFIIVSADSANVRLDLWRVR
ncbi:MAG: hypothetical protein V2A56_01630 [bacterium]